MQENELRELLINTIKALREQELSSEERDRRADEMLPALLRARYAADEVAPSDAILATLVENARARPATVDTSLNGHIASFFRRVLPIGKDRPRRWRPALAGAALAIVLLIAVMWLFIGRPHPRNEDLVHAPVRPILTPHPRNGDIVRTPPRTNQSSRPQPQVPRERAIVRKPPEIKVTPAPRHNPSPVVRPKQELVTTWTEIGRFVAVMGEPTWRILTERKSHTSLPRAPFPAGVRIETGDADKAEIQFKDGTTIALSFNTVLEIPVTATTAADRQAAALARPESIRLAQGMIWSKVQHDPNRKFALVTPVATAEVLGTEFGLKLARRHDAVREDVQATLSVKLGRVRFYNSYGSIEAPAMTESTVRAAAKPTEPRRLTILKTFRIAGTHMNVVETTEKLTISGVGSAFVPALKGFTVERTPGGAWEVGDVTRNSPAREAGLRSGDRIVSIGGRAPTKAAFRSVPNSTRIVVVRDGKELRISLRPDSKPVGRSGIPRSLIRSLNEAGSRASAGDLPGAQLYLEHLVQRRPHPAVHDDLGIVLEMQDRMGPAIKRYQAAISLDPTNPVYHSNLANALKKIGNLARAVEEYKHALHLDARHWQRWLELAEAASLAEETVRATAVLTEALRRFPSEPEMWKDWGTLLINLKRPADAEKAFAKALAIHPRYVQAWDGLGRARMAQKNYSGAITALSKGVEVSVGKSLSIQNSLGAAYHNSGDFKQAERVFRNALTLQPDQPAILTNLAESLIKRNPVSPTAAVSGRYREAETLYQKAIRLSPEDVLALVNYGALLSDLGRLDAAEEKLMKALELDPVNASAYTDLGNVYAKRGLLQQAAEAHRKAISLDPDDFHPHFNLGAVLFQMRDLPGAEREYRKAIEAEPSAVGVHVNLGALLAATGRLAEAEKLYRRAVELDPREFQAHYNLGNLLYGQGQLSEAESAYRRALELTPNSFPILNNLALVLAEHGIKLDEALTLANRAVTLAPDDGGILDTLGWVRIKRREYGEAVTALKKATSLIGEKHPGAPEVWLHLGLSYEGLSDKDSARAAFQTSLRLNPAYKEAAEAIKRLRP